MIDCIRIGLWWYRVAVVNNPRDASGKRIAADENGCTRIIRIKRSTLAGDWENSIIHEAIHCLDEQSCLGLDEHQTRVLANGMEAFIRDNPDFMRGESDDHDTRAGSGGEHQRGEPEQFGG